MKIKKTTGLFFSGSICLGLLFLLISCGTAPESRDGLVLASGGKCDYQVVLPVGAGETLRGSARLIAEAFEANGYDIPVVPEDQADAAKPGIFLGGTDFSRQHGIKPDRFESWDYLLRVEGKNLIIAGSNEGERQGVVKGVCDFLREYAGTRFLFPGRTGVEFLESPRIAVPADLDHDHKHPLKFNFSGSIPGDPLYYIANNHFPTGFDFRGHMYQDAIPPERFYTTHPKYFALVDGERLNRERSQYCISNPGVMELIVQHMAGMADRGNEIVVLAQPDAFTPCQCEACYEFYGTGDDWDNKLWMFHREIAERFQEARPGVKVMMLGYQATTHPPEAFRKFPDNTMIHLSHYYDEALEEWRESGVEVPAGYAAYLYYWGSYMYINYLPKRNPQWLESEVKKFYDMNFKGMLPDASIYCFGMEGPAYYVWGRMWGDPENNNAEALLEEYYTAAYREAAVPMKRFFGVLHEQLNFFCDWYGPRAAGRRLVGIDGVKPGGVDDPLDWVHGPTERFGARGTHRTINEPARLVNLIYTADVVSRMEQELDRAESLAVAEKVRARLALVRLEFNYLKHLSAVNNLYNAYRISRDPASLERLLDGLVKWHALLDSMYDGEGGMKPLPGWPEMKPFRGTGRSNLGLVTARWWERQEREDNPFAWTAEMRAELRETLNR